MSSGVNLSIDPNGSFHQFPSGYAYNCFPVRNTRRYIQDNGGAWLVEYRAKKKKEIETDLHKQFLRKKLNSKKKHKYNKPVTQLTPVYLVKQSCVKHPLDVCTIKISGKQLHTINQQDFSLFENMISIDASDNKLTLETFQTFPKLEDLQLQVNNISKCSLSHKDFICLKSLDLSFNPIQEEILLMLGKLRNLETLNLQGCELSKLPPELARGYLVSQNDNDEQHTKSERKRRFPELQALNLSENLLTDISTFASLAGLRKLKTLNISHNKVTCVPHLRLLVAHRHFSSSTIDPQDSSKSIRCFSGSQEKSVSKSTDISLRHHVSKISDSPNLHSTENNKTFQQYDPGMPLPDATEGDLSNLPKNDECSTDITDLGGKTNNDEGIDPNQNIMDDKLVSVGDNAKVEISDAPTVAMNSAHKDLTTTTSFESNQEKCNETNTNDVEDTLERKSDEIDANDNKINGDNGNDTLDRDGDEFHIGDNIADSLNKEKDEETDNLLNIDFSGKEINFGLSKMEDDLGLELDNGNTNDNNDLVTDEIKCPFASLELLDLSYNEINDEEALLALTSWTALQQLNLWGNPLMTSCKGIPTVLHHHLEKMCGIKVCKKEPDSAEPRKPIAPAIASTTKTYRVKTDLPPIKRNNLLMIEAEILNALENKKPQAEKHDSSTKRPAEVPSNSSTIKSDNEQSKEKYEGEQVFLTQVDEDGVDGEEEEEEETTSSNDKQDNKHLNVDSKYRGYELLLQSNDNMIEEHIEEQLLPPTIQSSVKALKLMIDHPLLFKEGEYNQKKVELNKTRKKKTPKVKPLHYTTTEGDTNIVTQALDYIRNESNSYQANLADVLENYDTDPEVREKFPEVKGLLKNVQKKYDEVRLNSLHPMSHGLKELNRTSTRSDRPSQDLILARMKKNKIGDLYGGGGSRGGTPRTKFRGTTPSINK